MPKIKSYTDQFLGDIVINFSVSHNRFDVRVDTPVGFKCDEHLKDWDSVERYLAHLVKYKKYESHYIRKVIHLNFKSTELGTTETTPNGIYLGGDKMLNGVGFTLDWYVLDEFTTYWNSEEYRNSKDYQPMIGERTSKFTIIEAHNGYGDDSKIIGKTDILGQLFGGNGITLDYSDELYDFLISTEDKLKEIILQLANFINPDPKVLLQNIANNQLRLGE